MDTLQLQAQQRQQKQQQQQQTTMAFGGGRRPQSSSRQQQQQPLGGKDLIIRMLAEVFQVNQTDGGQVKWRQVSTSLVPVSLYSRTTSRWLNYLLDASSVAASNTVSAMSPDSRDFLLLLQQFHQQQQTRPFISSSSHGQIVDEQNLVLFQVVAHDFIDGQCKKILNVKIAQPGTRLGQASDYFVYWKEMPSSQQAAAFQCSSSFASNTSLGRQFALHLNGRQLSGLSPNNNNNSFLAATTAACCQPMELQTWGLNFASTNDAKLFYDICSLNLVDLDFNSDYLKHLAMSDSGNMSMSATIRSQYQQQQNALAPPQTFTLQNSHHSSMVSQQNEQKIIRDFLNYKQRRLQFQSQSQSTQQSLQSSNKYHLLQQQQQHLCQTNENSIKRQLSASKCPSCKMHLIQMHQQAQRTNSGGGNQRRANGEGDGLLSSTVCPIHPGYRQHQQQTPAHYPAPSMRSRSRSTARHPINTGGNSIDSLKRARSFSTPASPNGHHHNNKEASASAVAACPIHQRASQQQQHRHHQEVSTDCEQQQSHHPRCMSYMRKQKELLKRQSTTESERPPKPMRGVLRETLAAPATTIPISSSSSKVADRPPPVPVHQSSVASSQSLHTKRAPKARYMGHLASQNSNSSSNNNNSLVPTKQSGLIVVKPSQTTYTTYQRSEGSRGDHAATSYTGFIEGATTTNANENDSGQNDNRPSFEHQDQQAATRFASSRSSLRRSTGVDSGNIEQFNSLSHRNARLARAQYANSKNMKEFLSLDAGGQTTPTQLAALNERFQQQMKMADGVKPTEKQQVSQVSSKQQEQQKLNNNNNNNNETLNQIVPLSHQSHKRMGSSSSSSTQQAIFSSSKSERSANGKGYGDTTTTRQTVLLLKRPEEMDATRMNVSTTTEDLPLDPLTRKRMFKLTSEEIISERTEPRSLSTPSMEQLQQQQARIEEKVERQGRAVSLGPEQVDKEVRGRSARSDVGRRRSLERSMCVDLDSSVPINSFKKSYCLSPLQQSGLSPMDQPSTKSPSPSYGGLISKQQKLRMDQQQNFRETHADSTLKRARTRSSGESEPCCLASAPGDRVSGGGGVGGIRMRTPLAMDHGRNFDAACQHQFGDRMLSFKSAPDVSQLCSFDRGQVARSGNGVELVDNHFERIHHHQQHHNAADDHHNHHHQHLTTNHTTAARNQLACPIGTAQQQPQHSHHFLDTGITLTIPKSGPAISSYAVPLHQYSSDHRDHQHARQFHSCPNSLRRKRRDDVSHHDRFQLQQQHSSNYAVSSALNHVNECSCQLCLRAYLNRGRDFEKDFMLPSSVYHHQGFESGAVGVQGECAFCAQKQSADADFAAAKCAGCNNANLTTFSNKSNSQQQHQQHRCQQHHTRLTCMNNVSSEVLKGYDKRFVVTTTAARPDCGHSSQAAPPYRPCSSQSSRSPLRYGLYESDCEDEPLEGDFALAAAITDTNTCQLQQAQLRQMTGCCGGGAASADNYELMNRSSSVYFRPTFRPVQGYDQTLPRAALKSRQRAKSQPPVIEMDETSFHLTKSMENVQKLIKEVQNELNVLKRQPLSELQSCLQQSKSRGSSRSLRRNNRSPDDNDDDDDENNSNSNNDDVDDDDDDNNNINNNDDRLQLAKANRSARSRTATSVSCSQRTVKKMSNEESGLPLHHQTDDRLTTVSSRPAPKMMSGTSSATRRAGQFKCVGAIRKAGFLSVKKWILKRRQSIELARKQGWKRYWVCLRGTALLFHSVIDKKDMPIGGGQESDRTTTDLLSWIQTNCGGGQMQMVADIMQQGDVQQDSVVSQEAFMQNMSQCYIEKEPRHLIIIEGAIAQPIPEHPKRDYVLCLSTTFGDAYLFQASCQLESDNWISAIHNACAASIARDLTRDEAVKLFETKIRHLELEAEKKLFLRQRLDSRLTSMSSMSHISTLAATPSANNSHEHAASSSAENDAAQAKKVTMRSLLYRLNQQLLTLDTYIEQVHCEVYQLRCYLSSCGAQHTFYQSVIKNQQNPDSTNSPAFNMSIDLPHPKSLLMHVSKPTKLLLIKLGVFTVSSFHAYIHARQGSAESILQKIQQQRQQLQQSSSSSQQSHQSPLELRVRSHSISETLLNKTRNVELENDTEQLIHMTNLKAVSVRLTKKLFGEIRRVGVENLEHLLLSNMHSAAESSDDRYSIQYDGGDNVIINLKLHSNSSSMSIIKQVLNIIDSNSPDLDFLNYYLRFSTKSGDDQEQQLQSSSKLQYVAKRRELLNDWMNFDSLELVEKIIFKVELSRRRIDEEASPFGISIGAQLFVNRCESLLNVYCSYIEWGSVADKAGLRDDDEFLMINGVPVMDLDMMFIECIIQDETKLRLVVRSSRTDTPDKAMFLDRSTWRPHDKDDRDDKGDGNDNYRLPHDGQNLAPGRPDGLPGLAGSQIISDEYISSLVCPPPPAQSSAFLRTDSTLLRQKSDMGISGDKHRRLLYERSEPLVDNEDKVRLASSSTIPSIACEDLTVTSTNTNNRTANDQPNLDSSSIAADESTELKAVADDINHQSDDHQSSSDVTKHHQKAAIGTTGSGVELANQLVKKTEQLTRLLGKNPVEPWNELDSLGKDIECAGLNDDTNRSAADDPGAKKDPNSVERLKKSILELLETEYAYIRHLETISEHYMTPLQEMAYLNIPDLEHLNQIIVDLITFQRHFFDKLTKDITTRCELNLSGKVGDEFEALNKIVQQIELFNTVNEFKPLLESLAKTFLGEGEKFKIYAAYCAAYSRLQRLLHPKRIHGNSNGSSNFSASTQIAANATNALDTFLHSNVSGVSGHIGSAGTLQHRDFLKPLGSFMATNSNNNNSTEFGTQLRQLSEFLGNLDSSSSSASLSLPKSSSSDQNNTQNDQQKKSTKGSSVPPFQKSVHQQNFESYLIKPIQRIVKYPMLLNSIAISAQVYAGDDGVHSELQAAVKQMESVTSHVNDTQRIHDEYGAAFDQIERQFLLDQQTSDNTEICASSSIGPHQPPISLSIEQLLYFGSVDWLNINEFATKLKKGINLSQVLFVFNSCVVFICKEQMRSSKKKLPMSSTNLIQFNSNNNLNVTSKTFQKSNHADLNQEVIRYQSLIPVSEVQVRSVPVGSSGAKSASSSELDLYKWELFRCSSVNSNSSLLTKSNKRNTNGKVYLLASPSNEVRNAFLRKIRFIIRESVRNMSLPLARSPSSKSLTPKKLSSPSSGTNTNSSCSHSTSLSPVCNSGEHCKQQDDVECKFNTGQVDNNNYTTSIKVNY